LIAQENLLRQGFHVYLPRIQARKHCRGKWVKVVEPLFPRYLFIRVDPDRHSTASVRSTRGAVGLVRFGGQPAVVPDEVIEAISQQEDEATGLCKDDRIRFCEGQSVRVVEGPLAGMEGVFAQEDGEARVIVLMELLGKANKVRVSCDWVAPVG
jgi:transcriptional antiterminator RfaH